MTSKQFSVAFATLCLLSFAVLIAAGLDSTSRWSFAGRCDGRDAVTYYYAALGVYEGLSPYDRGAILRQLNETPLFVYPLFAVPFFLPLIAFGLETALVLFGILHLIGFAGLVLLWHRLLPIDWRLLAVLLPVGFGAAAVHDLCSSNVVVFEALAVWLGIAHLWRGRVGRFATWTAMASVPKLLWLALLPLALWRSLPAWRAVAATAVGAALLFGCWLLAWPETMLAWLGNVLGTTGIRYNVFTILRDLDRALGGEIGGSPFGRWEVWAYAAWLVFVAAIFLTALRRKAGLRSLSLLAPLTLLAMWPGNLSYSWLIALPCAAAVIFFLAGRGVTVSALLLVLLCVLPQPLLHWAGLPFGHATFVVVLAFWAVLSGIVLRRGAELESWLGDAGAGR